MTFRLYYIALITLAMCQSIRAHKGPDPLGHWIGQPENVQDGQWRARIGPNGKLNIPPRFVKDPAGTALVFEGKQAQCMLAENYATTRESLPTEAMTVSAWVSVDTPRQWGGIIGTIQDNGYSEQGWVLGYDDHTFYFALATKGADDGNGQMTYLKGKTRYTPGKLYHVTAVYDGKTMELYINGKRETTSAVQSGAILYPKAAPYVIGAYRDSDEFHPHHGRIREIKLYNEAAKADWVAKEFVKDKALAEAPANLQEPDFKLLVAPYLQFATQTSMTVMWHTAATASSTVHYGPTAECKLRVNADKARIHEVTLTGLKPETQYFYRVESVSAKGERYESKLATFKTAVRPDTPFTFAVISDTQGNPKVSSTIATAAWMQRPSFALHAGDLVSTGSNHNHWTDHFFPGMRPLINHVPFYPVLGNHEQNARHYYNYTALPEPEYFYTFTFGNAQFFMLDTNQNVDPDSRQYQWLSKTLAASKARWKFVCHHHPPYSSDSNDYGDLWKTNNGTHGDRRARQLVALYEKHKVDIVWNGHIHSYERTWPIRDGKAVEENAPFYMITGGGGGGLEDSAPTRPFFQNNVRHGHHYVMVHINGGTLELKAYTLDNRLFDYVKLKKP